jgi:cytochrome c553
MELRLMAAIAGALVWNVAHAQGIVKGDPAKAQATATQVCGACHAADGNSTMPVNPVLAGQHAEYLYKQLNNFKSAGGKPAERQNPVMAGMVASLSQDDMANLSAYYAGQKAKPRSARDAELVKQGQAIYRGGIAAKGVAACSSCHSPTGAGIPAQYPRLAGQHQDYTAAQLKAFRAGERANDPNRMMRVVANRLTDREIAAVAEYVAGLR